MTNSKVKFLEGTKVSLALHNREGSVQRNEGQAGLKWTCAIWEKG